MSVITESDFKDWKDNPVTKLVYEAMQEVKNDMIMFLAQGGTIRSTDSPSTEYIVGRIQGVSDFLLAELGDLESTSKESASYEH